VAVWWDRARHLIGWMGTAVVDRAAPRCDFDVFLRADPYW